MDLSRLEFRETDSLKRKIDGFRPFPRELAENLRENLIVDWTYNSNAIEGNTLTLSETKVVLEYGLTVHGKPLKDHLEAVNHRDAIDFLLALADKKEPIGEGDIRSIHRLVLKEIDDENAGKYRSVAVRITGASHVPPDPFDVPDQMRDLVEKCNGDWKSLHPIVQSALLSGEFAKIHPFIDGNGRTSRLLMNLVLLRNGYQPVIVPNQRRLEYIESLDKAHSSGDYSAYVAFIDGLEKDKEHWLLDSVLSKTIRNSGKEADCER